MKFFLQDVVHLFIILILAWFEHSPHYVINERGHQHRTKLIDSLEELITLLFCQKFRPLLFA